MFWPRAGSSTERNPGIFAHRWPSRPARSCDGRSIWGAIHPYPRVRYGPVCGDSAHPEGPRPARTGGRERAAPWGGGQALPGLATGRWQGRRAGLQAGLATGWDVLGGDTPLSADKVWPPAQANRSEMLPLPADKPRPYPRVRPGPVCGDSAQPERPRPARTGGRERAAPWGGGTARPGLTTGRGQRRRAGLQERGAAPGPTEAKRLPWSGAGAARHSAGRGVWGRYTLIRG